MALDLLAEYGLTTLLLDFAMVSLLLGAWLLWSVSVGCYGQSLLVAMVSLCWLLWSVSVGAWLLWSVSVGCYGQSLLVAMVSLCRLLWSVYAGCYSQSLSLIHI